MKDIVTVIHYERVETRCVVIQFVPLILRPATLLERFRWWHHVKRCYAQVWLDDHMTWRAKKQAAQIIERVKA